MSKVRPGEPIKGIAINRAGDGLIFEERINRIGKRVEKTSKSTKMYREIDKLVAQGKSSGAIRQTIKKLFPELVEKMENQKLPLIGDKEFKEKMAQITGCKEVADVEKQEIYIKIYELINEGKTPAEIKEVLKNLFPELSAQMRMKKIPLPNEEIDRLTAQLRDRVEKFRNTIPAISNDDGVEH